MPQGELLAQTQRMTTIDQSPIIWAGISALRRIEGAIDYVFSKRPTEINSIVSDGALIGALEQIYRDVALIYECLFDESPKRASESEIMYSLRIDRIKEFKSMIPEVNTDVFRQRGVRNAMAHFAERFTKALASPSGDGLWLQDLALGSTKSISPAGVYSIHRMIRVYVYETDNFYVFGESLSLLDLKSEAAIIISRLPPRPR